MIEGESFWVEINLEHFALNIDDVADHAPVLPELCHFGRKPGDWPL